MPPKAKNWGRVARISNHAPSGTQNPDEPQAHGGGQMGGPGGRSPHGRGSGGCAPRILKEGASCPPLQPRHEWDPERWQTLSLRGWGKGVEGAVPPPRGFGGCAPKNIKIRGELPTLATPPRVGPRTLANPKPTGVGKEGPGGASPMAGGVGDVPPRLASPTTIPNHARQDRIIGLTPTSVVKFPSIKSHDSGAGNCLYPFARFINCLAS